MKTIKLDFPMYNALEKYANSDWLPFHMPGHKGGRMIPEDILKNIMRYDLTELSGLDNLHFPEGIIKDAQGLAANAVGASHTFFLVNGSTVGILASIMTVVAPGEKIIIGRDCHRAAINAMTLAGAIPIYVKPDVVRDFGISGTVNARELELKIKANPDAKAVYITRPTYYGICADIEKIAAITKKNGMMLIVDEAHGAHLPYSQNLVKSAIGFGADIVVQSAHKTLPSLTQTGYLHVCGNNVDLELLKQNLSILHTTSPSYIFMFFLDYARSFMQEKGAELLLNVVFAVDKLRNNLCNNTDIRVLENIDLNEGVIDPTRLIINVGSLGISGYEFDKILRVRYNILTEMRDLSNIVFITTVTDTTMEIDRLSKVIESLAIDLQKLGETEKMVMNIRDLCLPTVKMTLNEAYRAKYELVSLDKVVGRICKHTITPYPPGIPLICPGEEFSKDILDVILEIYSAGGKVDGLEVGLETGSGLYSLLGLRVAVLR